MYQIYLDDTLLYDPRLPSLAVLEPRLELEINTSGTLSLKLPPAHPLAESLPQMVGRVRVLQDGEELFKGRIRTVEQDFRNRRQITCEGELAFLNDSIQRPAEYHGMTVRGYLQTLLDLHNEQVEEGKQFEVGYVTVTEDNDSIFRYTNYNSTWTELKEDLVDDLGGCLRVRNVYDSDGFTLLHRYLDYIYPEDYGSLCSQTVEFGSNLVDFTGELDMTELATVIIPLGAPLEEDTEDTIAALNERVTIRSVNDGLDYLENTAAIEKYGRITKTVEWDGVTLPTNLLKKAQAYLEDYQYENLTLEVTAVDLHLTGEQFDALRLGDRIRVQSQPHGLNRVFPLSKQILYLAEPERNTITLGSTVKATLTNRTASLSADLTTTAKSVASKENVLNTAKANATALLEAMSAGGYVVVDENEILIMDTPDKTTATKVWRWNAGGLGYSSTGYDGTYGTAITMDGGIVADFITAGTVSAERLKLGDLMTVYKDATVQEVVGYICYLAGAGADTAGVGVMDSSKRNYCIATTDGTRMAAGEHQIYVTDEGGVALVGANATLTTAGNLSLAGDVYLNSLKQIYFNSLSMLGLSASGFFAGNSGENTYIRGKNVYINTADDGAVYVNGTKIG